MDFPINAKAEGRVLVPWENRNYPNTTNQDYPSSMSTTLEGQVKADWGEGQSTWEAFRRTCPSSSAARRLFSSSRNIFPPQINHFCSSPSSSPEPSEDFYFSRDTNAGLDFCRRPWA